MSKGTLIHGIGASEHLDSSGERISIDGLDISSLERGEGVLNYEHKNENASHVVGKVINAKKIFSEKDCQTEQEFYFWSKSQAPFLYIVGELFDKVGHQQAQEVAAMLKYDSLKRKEDPKSKNVINFSVEGAKLEKQGNEISKSIARKVSITIVPCNKAAIAEEFVAKSPIKSEKIENPVDKFFKSEPGLEIQVLEKAEKLQKSWSHKVTSRIPGKQAVSFVHPQHGIVSVVQQDNQYHVKHNGAIVGPRGAQGIFTSPKDALTHAKGYVDSLTSGKGDPKRFTGKLSTKPQMGKNLASAPGSLTGTAALSKERLIRKIKKSVNDAFLMWPKSKEVVAFISEKRPDLSKSEVEALAKMVVWKQTQKAEKALDQMEKGVARKLFPYNPTKTTKEEKEKVRSWQDYGVAIPGSSGPKWQEDPSSLREDLPKMDENARQRGLLKLSGKTNTRKNPQTGEREYLLHRGILPHEEEQVLRGAKFDYNTKTSWTPHESIARDFTKPEFHSANPLSFTQETRSFYEENPDVKPTGMVISAWIPESKITQIPKMYGNVDPTASSRKNRYGAEHEIIVEPHRGEITDRKQYEARPSSFQRKKQDLLTATPKKLAASEPAKKALTLSEEKAAFCKPTDEGSKTEELKKENYDKWRPNSDQEIENEYNWEYKSHWGHTGLFPTVDHFKNAIKNSKTVEITPEIDSNISNRSRTGSLEELRGLTSKYKFPRDVDRIAQGLKQNEPIPMPIVIKRKGKMAVMSGNTRMDASFLHGANPRVHLIDLDSQNSEVSKKSEPLMKPYVSEAQRKWAHTPAGTKALGGEEAVSHWDKESKGKSLPKKVKN